MQEYIAVTTIGPSTLRNQGSKGVIRAAQQYLAVMNIRAFSVEKENIYLRVLDDHTERLRITLPKAAQNWGAARKALNLYLRDICYNRFLCERYNLSEKENWMEIPLDSFVASSLKKRAGRGQLPCWPGLNGLTPEISFKFQKFAKHFAANEGISRIHLDMRLWMDTRENIIKIG